MEEQITIWTAETHRRDELRKALPQKEVRRLIHKKGGMCICCETEDRLELHHIIPLSCGGDHRESNLVPLCETCHYMAHHKKPKPKKRIGRKPKEKPEGFNDVADAYIRGEYTLLEAMEILSLKKSSFYRMLDAYKEETGDTRKVFRKRPKGRKYKKGVVN